jgi:protocadherin Fat 1/2/3
VEIVDVNENRHAPRFEDFVATATVPENQPVGTVVTRVTAKDADPPGDDSRLAYSIRGGDGLGYFSIDDQGKNNYSYQFNFQLSVSSLDSTVVNS